MEFPSSKSFTQCFSFFFYKSTGINEKEEGNEGIDNVDKTNTEREKQKTNTQPKRNKWDERYEKDERKEECKYYS